MENTLYIKDNMDSPNYEVFYKDNIPSVDHPLHYHDFLEIYYMAVHILQSICLFRYKDRNPIF